MSQSSYQSRKRSSGSEQSGTTRTSKPYSAYSGDIVRRRLTQPRPSLSPSQISESDFSNFKRHNARARTEPKAIVKVVPIIAGDSDDRRPFAADVPFGHLEPVDKDLVKPEPDIYYGAKPEQVDRRVRDELGKYILPSSDTSLPAVPNYFLEGKSAKGRADVAVRQACYDLAVEARAMYQLQNYGASTSVYNGNAYTIANTFQNGYLQIYATHPTEPKDPSGQSEYHMTSLGAYAMTHSSDNFRQGVGAYRNGRDWAKEQRHHLIAHANEMARRRSAEPTLFSTVENSRTSLSTVAEADFAKSEYVCRRAHP